MAVRFHNAARDGFLDPLKEATRRDLNTPDPEGLSPTLMAASRGHLEALRLCVSRGGDPERSDLWGNSALHLAAGAGHLECVAFLADMNAGLWALDNNFHSALELAALRGNSDCVALLDAAVADKTRRDPRGVTRAKEKARREAEKRVEETTKLQEKHQRRMVRAASLAGTQGRAAAPAAGTRRGFGTLARIQEKFKIGTLSRAAGQKEAGDAAAAADPGDAAAPGEHGSREETEPGGSEFEEQRAEDDDSVFNRPGLGNMVFRRNFMSGGAYNVDVESVRGRRADSPGAGEQPGESGEPREGGGPSSLALQAMWDVLNEDEEEEGGGNGEPARDDLPWEDAELDLDDDGGGDGPLLAFLAAAGVDEEFAPACRRERLDLAALLLCSEGDLAALGLPLGPRKRLLAAVDKRRRALASPAAAAPDTKL